METLFSNILTASFYGSVVICAVLLLRLLLRKAPKKYLCMLWILAGLRLLMPFQLESKLSLQPEHEVVTQTVTAVAGPRETILPPELMGAPDAYGEDPVQQELPEQPFTAAPTEAPAVQQTPAPSEEPIVTVVPEKSFDRKALIPWVWLTVAVLFGIYSFVAYFRLKRKVRLAVKIPGGWECDGIDTAFILGFVKPKIYIPVGISREDRRHILAHERTHLEKGDHWVKMLGYIALAVHWFNPLVWLSYLLLCRDIEMACDERVVRFMELEDRKRYSAALLHCSTSKAHYAACPVAFGEVNVKQRILGVLNYRKPRFWVSLVSVVAIAFVAVCLLTTPKEEAPEGTEPPASESTAPQGSEEGFASTLSESEVIYICRLAIESLKTRENYYIVHDYACVSESASYGSYTSTIHLRRAGQDSLISESDPTIGARMNYGGQSAWYNGGAWLWEGEAEDPNEWMEAYDPNGKEVSEPKVVSGDTVSFRAGWTEWGMAYEGIFTFTFDEEGGLTAFGREYTYHGEDGDVTFTSRLALRDESYADTLAQIAAVADQTMTHEEYEDYMRDLETVTEVPSNKTSYDKDFALGAGSKQWEFFQERAHVRIGAEEASPTGLFLHYSEADNDHVSFTAEEGYWLEQLVDGTWVMLQEYAAPERSVKVTWTTTDRYQLTWDEPLSGGFYRVGRYHTMELATGEKETAVCYAKFRLYDAGEVELMAQARKIWNDFFENGVWHIYCIDWMTDTPDMEYYMTNEVWRVGAYWLSDTRYVDRLDSAFLHGRRGGMIRGGTNYDLTWAGDGINGPVKEWTTNTYMNETNFTLWSFGFEWYDSQVESVERQGNKIIIQEVYDFNDLYEVTQTVLILNDDGTLGGMRKLYLPTRDCPDSEVIVDQDMVVLSNSGEEIRAAIIGVDLTYVPAFDWASEERELKDVDGVRTVNFVNSTQTTLQGAQAAIDRARRDCTLPAAAGMEPGTNMSKAYYDEEAKVWKIEFTASWDDRIYEAVYMTDRGVTLMTSTAKAGTPRRDKLPVWLMIERDRLYFVGDGEKLDITDLITESIPFTYIIGGTETAGRKTYVAVGGDYPNFGYFEVYRDYEPGMGDHEGWLDGSGVGHWDNEKNEERHWYTVAQKALGTPYP